MSGSGNDFYAFFGQPQSYMGLFITIKKIKIESHGAIAFEYSCFVDNPNKGQLRQASGFLDAIQAIMFGVNVIKQYHIEKEMC